MLFLIGAVVIRSNEQEIAKLKPSLNVDWVSTVNGNVSSYSIVTDGMGSSYIGGQFSGTATFPGSPSFTVTSSGPSDAFIAKYKPGGTVWWAKGFGGPGNDAVRGVSIRGSILSARLIVTGYFRGTASFGGTPTFTSSGGSDIFIARYRNYDGLFEQAIAAGGSHDDEGIGISSDGFGKASVTGTYKSNPAMFTGTSPNLTNTNVIRNAFFAKATP